ncbi:MAG: MmgE/PrpD family protein [Theionarchaea archaeon]|nr:MmgE/PrpD family protein [Theionarchaea archaeon]
MKALTLALAEHFTGLQFEDVPSDVVEFCKMCVLDMIGVSLRGAPMEYNRILAAYVQESGGKAESTVVGYGFKTSCAQAGLINGSIGHSLQLDDGEMASCAHLNCEIIPAALAVGERQDCSGKELITAIVAGNEGSIRIGSAVNPSHNQRGFSPNGTIGVFGAAIAAGKALGLTEPALADAIGSAAMQSAGLEQFVHDGSDATFLNAGHATQAGIQSALLAEKGFTGSREILEGIKGFCRAYSDEYHTEKIYSDLGKTYRILGTYFKFYPTCWYIQPALDALLPVVCEFEPDEVKEVIVKTYPIPLITIDNPHPATESAATLSMQCAIAAAIVHKKAGPDEFFGTEMNKGEISDLMKKIHVVNGEKELQEYTPGDTGSIVIITLNNGKTLEARTKQVKGDVGNFTKEDLIQKFDTLTSPLIDKKRQKEIKTKIENLESMDSVRELTQLLNLNL